MNDETAKEGVSHHTVDDRCRKQGYLAKPNTIRINQINRFSRSISLSPSNGVETQTKRISGAISHGTVTYAHPFGLSDVVKCGLSPQGETIESCYVVDHKDESISTRLGFVEPKETFFDLQARGSTYCPPEPRQEAWTDKEALDSTRERLTITIAPFSRLKSKHTS